ncbi:MAG: GTP-binding protein [Hydrococcus sp. RU_2_2]|nr:GTP-binding protein [Hydrococcus sp. RU_2_2]NJP19891.1 GTP-binding protein [Hydrococcus sp. CRU_1_1]
MITAIAGLPGSGKTHWIREQIAKTTLPVLYFSPQTDSVPIDATYLQSEFPNLLVLSSGEEDKLFTAAKESRVYLELPWYLDLSAIEPLLQQLDCHRVAMMSQALQNTGFEAWADEVIPGNNYEARINGQIQIHRGVLSGEILDFASLSVFWYELICGAYGEISRVKGIFEIADGQCIYGKVLKGIPPQEFEALNLPVWLEGRPQRFSGFEIVGCNLDKEEISQTLQDCLIPEAAIAHYQQQVKESLEEVQV